jgi:hypothetical protein
MKQTSNIQGARRSAGGCALTGQIAAGRTPAWQAEPRSGGGIGRVPSARPNARCLLRRQTEPQRNSGHHAWWQFSRCENSDAQRSAGAAEGSAGLRPDHASSARCAGRQSRSATLSTVRMRNARRWHEHLKVFGVPGCFPRGRPDLGLAKQRPGRVRSQICELSLVKTREEQSRLVNVNGMKKH